MASLFLGTFHSQVQAFSVTATRLSLRHNFITAIGNSNSGDEEEPKTVIEMELERLQEQLSLIEALEARNEAQLDSFVDKEDQWNSLENEERTLLESKDAVVQRLDILGEQLVQLWMGQKSMEG